MKKIIATSIGAISILLFCGCSESVAPIDYGFDFKFLAEADTLDFTGYEILPGFGCTAYIKYGENSDVFVRYTVSGAPDCLDAWRVTDINCTDPEATFFCGLTLADDGKIKKYLENDGYKIETFDGIPVYFEAKKGRTEVKYRQNEFVIIHYNATNKQGVDF